jgi:hypothetical protein
MIKYCLSQEYNPSSFETYDGFQHVITILNLVPSMLLGIYIIFKMCLLCKVAYSYSNFYVHEAYKFYTLALISTISIYYY